VEEGAGGGGGGVGEPVAALLDATDHLAELHRRDPLVDINDLVDVGGAGADSEGLAPEAPAGGERHRGGPGQQQEEAECAHGGLLLVLELVLGFWWSMPGTRIYTGGAISISLHVNTY
jgi:hypothetical protein